MGPLTHSKASQTLPAKAGRVASGFYGRPAGRREGPVADTGGPLVVTGHPATDKWGPLVVIGGYLTEQTTFWQT